MIVTKNQKGWNIFFHRAHALLAFKIGMNLQSKFWPLPSYRLEGLSAITDHDNGQPDWHKQDNLTDAGAPLDYRQRKSTPLKETKELVERSLYKSSFMTLMISIHCCSLYKDQEEKQVKAFLNNQKKLQKTIRENLQLNEKDIEASYLVLRFCDELSLTLCQDDIPKNKRKIQLEPLPGLPENFLFRDKNGVLRFDNWIFEKSEVQLKTEFYQTKKLSYQSDKELIDELPMGSPKHLLFNFKKA
jgi:hypothetical protein